MHRVGTLQFPKGLAIKLREATRAVSSSYKAPVNPLTSNLERSVLDSKEWHEVVRDTRKATNAVRPHGLRTVVSRFSSSHTGVWDGVPSK